MHRDYSKLWLIVLLLLSLNATVVAAEPDPIVIVVTGTLLPSEISATPSLVEVIEVEPDDEIETVWELLDEIPGVKLNQNLPFPGGVSTVSIWGSHSSQVLILVDGVALNLTQDGTYDLSLLPVEAVERIEVQKGSSSSLYGTSAIGGVINIITKKGYETGTSLKLGMGSCGQRETALTSQGELAADTYYAVNLGYRSGDGYLKHSAYTSGDLYASVTRDLDLYSSITVSALAINHQSGIPAVGMYVEGDKQNNRLRLQGRYILEDVNGGLTEATLWADNDQTAYQSIYENSKHQTNTIGYNLIRSWVMNDNTLSVATDGRFDEVNSTNMDSIKRIFNFGLTAEVKAPLAESWEAVAAGRVDCHSQFGAHFSPRVGLVKSVSGGMLRLNVGSAFKAPTASDLYFDDPWMKGNPDLRPERSWSVEAQYLCQLKSGSHWGISGFYRQVDDLIDWADDQTGAWQVQNVAEIEIIGGELTVSQQISSDLSAQAHVTILSAVGYDKAVSSLVPLEYGLSLQYLPAAELTGTLKLAGAGERNNGLPGYTTVDVAANYQVRPGVKMHAAITNLFDEEYQLVKDYPMPGRQFKAGITWFF